MSRCRRFESIGEAGKAAAEMIMSISETLEEVGLISAQSTFLRNCEKKNEIKQE